MRAGEGSQDPAGGSSKFPSLAFRGPLAEWACGQGADGTRSFLFSLPTPHSSLLAPGPPPAGVQLKAKLKAAGVAQRWFPGLSSPPPPTPIGGTERAGAGSPPLQATQWYTSQRREHRCSWKKSQETARHPVLLPLHRGFKKVTLQTAQMGRGPTRGPPLRGHFQGEVCAVQKMCVCWGPEEP